jgi:general secretion pathway protein J
MRHHRTSGFTLVELLVAMFITAIMFTIGYRALDQAFRSRSEVEEQSARLSSVQQALRTMEQDFELLQPRPVRNLIGDGYLPALITSQSGTGSVIGGSNSGLGSNSSSSGSSFSFSFGSSSGASSSSSSGGSLRLSGSTGPLVTFTRGGWTNPAGIQRSELQRVSYSIENGALMRSYYPVLDATEAVLPVKRLLIDHVRNFSLRYMDAGHQWQTQWPPLSLGGTPSTQLLRQRPVAVEVTIEIEGWGILMRHIEIAG